MAQNETLLVNRKDFADLTLARLDDAALEDGYIRCGIGPWALTSNNITYMVTGDQIGYWQYFNPSDYGIDPDGIDQDSIGRMPVWGYAQVTESRCPDVPVGTRIYGFFPIAKSIDMKPVKLNPIGFQDGAPHRLPLHSVYNSYTITGNDPSFADAGLDDLQPVLRPLFTTSFLLDDFFADSQYFDAKQIILLSASSKTALGTAFCLKQRGDVRVTGLTSEGNMDFVKETGFYDDVHSYDTITDMNPDIPSAIIDMAGNGRVTGTLYDHFEELIVYNCMVGKSHWDGPPPRRPAKGAPPVLFFAPDHAKKRFSDWGADGFAKALGKRWVPFCGSAKEWLNIEKAEGASSILPVYKDFLEGRTDPAKGYLFSL